MLVTWRVGTLLVGSYFRRSSILFVCVDVLDTSLLGAVPDDHVRLSPTMFDCLDLVNL